MMHVFCAWKIGIGFSLTLAAWNFYTKKGRGGKEKKWKVDDKYTSMTNNNGKRKKNKEINHWNMEINA
jgi:hypothetical protein